MTIRPLSPARKNRVDRRQMFIEPHIHDTAADRNARAGGRGLHNYLFEHTQPFRNSGTRTDRYLHPRFDYEASKGHDARASVLMDESSEYLQREKMAS